LTTYRLWAWLAVVIASCVPTVEDDSNALGESTQPIIYGQDDRLEVYEHPDPTLRALAESSVVALIPRSQFARASSGNVAIFTRKLKDAFDVCTDERFAEQPTPAVCSGVLIDDDLVLTAGHCFPSDACERYAFAFDYFNRSDAGLASIQWGDIYGCRRIVHRIVSPEGSLSRIDYALVQLDRPAAGRTPAPIRTSQLTAGEPLATIGSVSGLPAKIDSGSRVLNTRAPANDYFLLDSDTFEGSSGSGVFDVGANLVGVLVRGGRDYEERPGADCMVPKLVALDTDAAVQPPGIGEEATYIGRVLEGLCMHGWPSARLCDRAPVCGDNFCTSGESRALCPLDCGCAQGACDVHASPPATPGAAVTKAKKPHKERGCALASEPSGLAGMSLLLAALALRRGRRTWRSDPPCGRERAAGFAGRAGRGCADVSRPLGSRDVPRRGCGDGSRPLARAEEAAFAQLPSCARADLAAPLAGSSVTAFL